MKATVQYFPVVLFCAVYGGSNFSVCDLLETIKMKKPKNNSRSQANTKVNKRKAKLDKDELSQKPEGVRKSPCTATGYSQFDATDNMLRNLLRHQ